MSIYIPSPSPNNPDIGVLSDDMLFYWTEFHPISARAKAWFEQNVHSTDPQTVYGEAEGKWAVEQFEQMGWTIWHNPELPINLLQKQIGQGVKYKHMIRQYRRFQAGEITHEQMRENCFPDTEVNIPVKLPCLDDWLSYWLSYNVRETQG